MINAYKKSTNPDMDESGLHFKDPKKIEEYKTKLMQLESCSFKCKELSDSEKALNLWPKDFQILEAFSCTNGFISIRMKDGKTLSANLLDVSTKFFVSQGGNVESVRCLVTCGGNSIEFITIAYLFKDEDWYDILNCLTWSGTTYNMADYITLYSKYHTKSGKALRYANGLLKGLRFLQKIS